MNHIVADKDNGIMHAMRHRAEEKRARHSVRRVQHLAEAHTRVRHNGYFGCN